jgi:hypothetical protein
MNEMNINHLMIKTPYYVTKSKYQFMEGDKVYLRNENIIVVQPNDEKLHALSLVGGSTGYAMDGSSGGFMYLDELISCDVFVDNDGQGDIPNDWSGDITLKDFLLTYDCTEFEPATTLQYKEIGTTSSLVKTTDSI